MTDTIPGPQGLGMFIWQWSVCEGGDVGKILMKAKKSGIAWIAMHFTDVTSSRVAFLKGAGLYVAAWNYCVPGTAETSVWIQQAVACRRNGVDAILPDCEVEWESRKDADGNVHPSDRRPEALVFAKALRDALDAFDGFSADGTGADGHADGHANGSRGRTWIGNCGAWQWPDRHPIYPDHAFGSFWDAGLPECYWTMFSPSEPAATALAESRKEWTDGMNAGAYKTLIEIGSAFDGKAQGGQPLRVQDVVDFLDDHAPHGSTCALWSWQHVSADVWAMLADRAASASTVPPPDALPQDAPTKPAL